MKAVKTYSPYTRILSLILSILIIFYVIPTTVFAENSEQVEVDTENSASVNEAISTYTPEIYEVTELRESNVKHFCLEDGSYVAAQYNYPVHYTDENGELVDINNRLEEGSGGIFANKNSRVNFVKKITGSGKLFTLSEGDTKIEMSVLNANKGISGTVQNSSDAGVNTELQKKMNLENLSSKILYKEVFDGVDIEYVLQSLDVKENIIVKEKSEKYTYSFELKLKNLTPTLLEDGSISFADNDGNIKYSIPAPVVYDSDMRYANEDTAKYTLEGKNGKYILILTVDSEWMNAESTLFPVTVDPTIVATSHGVIKPKLPTLMCVQTYIPLTFNISDVPTLPAGTIMTSAKLCLIYKGSGGFFVPRLTLSDTLTKGIYDISRGGYIWDITMLITKWHQNSWTSRNLTVSIDYPEDTRNLNVPIWLMPASCEFLSFNSPDLQINYAVSRGLENYYSYSSHSLENIGTGNVNLATGNLTFVSNLTTTTDYIMPLTISAIYNSDMSGKCYNTYDSYSSSTFSYMPYGYKLSIQETIMPVVRYNEDGNQETFYILSDGDGTEHLFYYSETGYVDSSSLGRYFEVGDSEITITYKNHVKKTYLNLIDPHGINLGWVLNEITDASGNSVIIPLNNLGFPIGVYLLPKNFNKSINLLKFDYNSNYKLREIVNVGNNDIITFKYSDQYNDDTFDNNGNYLRAIEYSVSNDSNAINKTIANFNYNSEGYLISVGDTLSGHSIEYDWSNKKTESVTHHADSEIGQTVKFEYGNCYTDVITSGNDENISTDEDNIISRYIFDDLGRATSVYSFSSDGSEIYGATIGKYETQDNAKNSLKEVATFGGSTANYIVNGSFEKGTQYWYASSLKANQSNSHPSSGNYCLEISPSGNEEGKLSQNVYLEDGSYTLSLKYNMSNADNTELYLRVKSSSGANIAEKQLSVNEAYTAIGYTFTSMNFEIDSLNSVTIEIAIKSASGQKVLVEDVMLEKGLGVGEYNMVQSGGFEASHLNESFTDSDVTTEVWKTVQAESVDFAYDSSVAFSRVKEISNGIIKQTVYSADSKFKYLEPNLTYRLSGFANASDVTGSGNFRLGVNVYYYQNSGDDVCVTHYFDFSKVTNVWQFVSGTFSGEPSNEQRQEGANYDRISKIEVICEFSEQGKGSFAYFDNISLTDVSNASINKYYYDDNGNLAIEKSLYNTVLYTYDNNNLVCLQTSKGENYSYTYNELNLLETETNNTNGTTTTYTYNDYGLVKKIETSGTSGELISSYSYNLNSTAKNFGAPIESTDTSGITTKYIYDSNNGRLLSTLTEGDGVAYTYDSMGRLESVLYAWDLGNWYFYETEGENVSYTYNSEGLLSTITTDSTTYSLSYDSFGNVVSVSAGSNILATYTYNQNNGKINKISYANGLVVEYFYNSLELIDKVCYTKNNNNVGEYEYTYTRDGQLHSIKDTVQNTYTVFEYDSGGKLTGSYEYNESDYVTYFSSNYEYDGNDGRLSSAIYGWNYTYYGTEYNVRSNNTYEYNIEGAVSNHSLSIAAIEMDIYYSYDDFNRLNGVNYSPNEGVNLQECYTYLTVDGYTTGLVDSFTSNVGDFSTTSNYTYDSKGNITKIVIGNKEIRYKYDELSQLIREDNGLLNATYVYTYDNAGNITSKKTYALTAAGVTPTSPTSTRSYTYGDTDWGDKLTSYNGTTITYDDIGNPINYLNGTIFTFEWTGRQLTAATKSGDTISFTYNDEGIRTSKTTNSYRTEYILNGTQILAEITSSYILIYIYDANGSPIGMQYKKLTNSNSSWEIFWYEKNLQGDIVAVYNASGTKLATYIYDAWGNYTATYHNGGLGTAAAKNPFRYRGYYYDADLRLYYLNSRYYDSNTGRFINADGYVSTGQGLIGYNMYAYCNNNPVNMADTTGELPFFLVTAAIGAVAGAILGGVVAAKSGGNVWAGIGIGAAAGGLAGAGLGAAAGVVLTGSATASTAAVVSGAGMVATAVSTGGAGAGLALVADNISRAINNVGTVLYSGGEQARQAATTFANNTGGTTIDSTVIGRVADVATKVPGADFTTVWSQASVAFCNQASGVVNAFVSNSAYRGSDSIFWSVEMPTLLNNPRVTEIIIHIFK